MTPISARCARCDSGFSLLAVVEDGTGACPQCLRPLVVGDPGALLEWAAVADAAQYRLSASVHLLQQIPGHLIVDWRSVVQSLAEEAGGQALGMVRPGVSIESRETRLGTSPRLRLVAAERRRFRQPPLRMRWRQVGSDGQWGQADATSGSADGPGGQSDA